MWGILLMYMRHQLSSRVIFAYFGKRGMTKYFLWWKKTLRLWGSRIWARLKWSKSPITTNLPEITFFLRKILNLDLACSETKVEMVLDSDLVVFFVFERSPRGLLWPDMMINKKFWQKNDRNWKAMKKWEDGENYPIEVEKLLKIPWE